MDYHAIVELLTWASARQHPVIIVTDAGDRIAAVPVGVDPGRDAFEVWIRPAESPEAEVSLSLGRIVSVELA
ncbi:MAG: hypothetical protein AB7L66_15630 [Gemmatimonadales bacterium]